MESALTKQNHVFRPGVDYEPAREKFTVSYSAESSVMRKRDGLSKLPVRAVALNGFLENEEGHILQFSTYDEAEKARDLFLAECDAGVIVFINASRTRHIATGDPLDYLDRDQQDTRQVEALRTSTKLVDRILGEGLAEAFDANAKSEHRPDTARMDIETHDAALEGGSTLGDILGEALRKQNAKREAAAKDVIDELQALLGLFGLAPPPSTPDTRVFPGATLVRDGYESVQVRPGEDIYAAVARHCGVDVSAVKRTPTGFAVLHETPKTGL
jgi:hypothetical protein